MVNAVGTRVYEAIADELTGLSVTQVFGLMGEDTATLTSELIDRGIAYYSARHESGAIGMADGYSWASGSVGVALVTRGPGLTNALTALHTSVRGRRQVLVITGDVSADNSAWAEDAKYLDAAAVAASIGLEFLPVRSSEEALPRLREAFALAASGRPALLSVSFDVFPERSVDGHPPLPLGLPLSELEPPLLPPPAATVDRIAELLKGSEYPLILVGRGAGTRDLKPQIELLAERIGALIGTTLLAKDLFRGNRLALGVVGGFASDPAWPLLAKVDCVLVLGSSLTRFTTGDRTLFEHAQVIHVDRDERAIGNTFSTDMGVVADVGALTDALLERIASTGGATKPFHSEEVIASLGNPLFAGEDESSATALDPRTLAVVLDELLPEHRAVVIDAGRFMTSPGRFIRVSGPDYFRLTVDAGSIGVALGPALGAAIARPDCQTVLFIGDGGAAMSIADLETAARYCIPLIVVVMNDHGFGAERLQLAAAGLSEQAASIDDMNFADVARAMGVEAERILTVDELRALAPRLHSRTSPLLLDCQIRDDFTTPRLRWRA